MIKAADAMAKFTGDIEAEYRRAEAKIDQEIGRMRGTEVTVDLWNVTSSPRVLDRIRHAYEDGGWKVEITRGDQRDPGPHVTLKASGR